MNRLKKVFILSLTFVLAFSSLGISNVSAYDSQLKDELAIYNQEDSSFVVSEEGVLIGGEFYSPEEFEEYLKSAEIIVLGDSDDDSPIQPSFTLAPAIYFVPGVGQVALLASGVIVVGGVTVAAGSWLYKTISNYFNDPQRVIASKLWDTKIIVGFRWKSKIRFF